MLDSAEYYLNLSKPITINGPIEKLTFLECLSEMALAQGDQLKHLQYTHQCKLLTDSLKALQETVKILNTEHEYDQVTKSTTKKIHKKTTYRLIGLIVIMLLLLSFILYRHKHRYDRIIEDFKQQSESQLSELAELQHNVNRLKIKDEHLKDFINSHLALIRDMIEACYHAPNSVLSRDIKNLITFQDKNKDNLSNEREIAPPVGPSRAA
jgi:cell division protein FtsL